jgi:hypothetical protein
MKRYILSIIIISIFYFIVRCTNSPEIHVQKALGKVENIQCFSGGEIIYEGVGLDTEMHRGTLYFEDKETKNQMAIYADCIVEREK